MADRIKSKDDLWKEPGNNTSTSSTPGCVSVAFSATAIYPRRRTGVDQSRLYLVKCHPRSGRKAPSKRSLLCHLLTSLPHNRKLLVDLCYCGSRAGLFVGHHTRTSNRHGIEPFVERHLTSDQTSVSPHPTTVQSRFCQAFGFKSFSEHSTCVSPSSAAYLTLSNEICRLLNLTVAHL
ncbi:hypothetical protein CC86DRAFT_165967 [Ophiobolus disseminans]|uniref:Uncharacterized protein n=1 Tax=Ophiobolus disseminans TaxID=1469910 RepID=A0A6A7ADD3_9PLEO|nr:hypothetical protein CC86DRAFT_165967 [Ophiobolus disseminans]